MQRRGLIAAFCVCLLGAGGGVVRAGQIEAERFDLPATNPGQAAFETINFRAGSERTPLVFVTPTNDGDDPAAVRVRNVTSSGFEIAPVEPPGADGPHEAMSDLSYIAIEPGRHELPGGMVIEAFAMDTRTTIRRSPPFGSEGGYDTVTFREAFGSAPAVIATVQTDRNAASAPPGEPASPWRTTSVINAAPGSVQIAMERSEVNDGNNIDQPERVAYLAVTRGTDTLVGADGLDVLINALQSADNVDNNVTDVPFDQAFGDAPLVVTGKSKRDGHDGGWIRIDTIDGDSVMVRMDEDQFNDGDRDHTSERVDVVAAERAFDATVGTLAAEFTWQGASSDWADGNNWNGWDGTNFRLASGDRLVFDDVGASEPNANVTVDYEALLESITFNDSTAYTINDGGGSLRLGEGGAITNNSDRQQAVDVPLSAFGSQVTIDAGSTAGGAFVFGPNAAIELSDTGGVELVVTGDNDTTLAGPLTGAGGQLTKTGSGTLKLSGDSTHTGATDIQQGGFEVGTSIGSASVDGSFRLRDNANWTVELDPTLAIAPGTSHDVLDADGPVQIDANAQLTLDVLAPASNIADGDRWVVLRSPSGITATGFDFDLDLGIIELLLDPNFTDGSIELAIVAVNDPNITWQGASADWADGANWENWDGADPTLFDDDRLLFNDTGAATTSTNLTADYNAPLAQLVFSQSTAYTINDGGGSFRMADGASITNNSDQLQTIDAPFAATGMQLTIDAGSTAGGAFVFGPNASIDLSHTGGVELVITGDNDTTVLAPIVGAGGRVTKTGSGTLTLGSASTHTGRTDVQSGSFEVGPGVGSASVGGDLRLRTGVEWVVDLDAAQATNPGASHDVLDAGGAAVVEADAQLTLNVLSPTSAIEHEDRFVFLRAAGGVTDLGMDTDIDLGLVRMQRDPAFSDDDGELAVVADRAIFSRRAVTGNSLEVARALDRINIAIPEGPTEDVLTLLDAMNDRQLRRTLRELSPESAASLRFAQRRTTRLYEMNIAEHVRKPGDELMSAGTPHTTPEPPMLATRADDPYLMAFAAGAAGPPNHAVQDSEAAWPSVGAFAQGLHVSHRRDDDSDHAGYSGRTTGGQLGLDTTIGVGARLGVAFGYTHTELDYNQGLGHVRSDAFRTGPYFGYTGEDWFANASLTYVLHRTDQERRIGMLNDEAHADRFAHDVAASVGGGLISRVGELRIEHAAAVQYGPHYTEGYREQGAGPVNLRVDGRTEHEVTTRLGMAISTKWSVGDVKLKPTAGAAWRHQWTSEVDGIDARFDTGGGAFTVEAIGPPRDAAVVRARIDVQTDRRSAAFVGYRAWLSPGDRSHAFTIGLALRF